MTTTNKAVSPVWAQAFAQPAPEFGPTALPVVSGSLPTGLQGSLYRNGAGRVERGGQKVGHWFDGDGAILAVHFASAGASATYRYVQTAEYLAEAQANRILFAGYGTIGPPRFHKGVKNAANTSVLALPDKLLALWEGGLPYSLDPLTLTTLGSQDLGELKSPYSAHPKRDPISGEIYNFGVHYGRIATLHLYRSSPDGRILQQNRIPLSRLSLIHDFVMAGPYLIFCIPPLQLNPLPLLFHLKSYSDCLRWESQKGTQILLIDRQTLNLVSQFETDPWFQWHFGNGYIESDGSIVLDVVCYADFQTNQYLKEVISGSPRTYAPSRLHRIRLQPRPAQVLENFPLLEQNCEFPTVDPTQVGRPHRHTYLVVHRPTAALPIEMFGAIACFDHQKGSLQVADLGPDRYASEPIYAPDAEDPTRGWILTVVLQEPRSQLWIFAADRLEDPVCRLELPAMLPPGFHGTYRRADGSKPSPKHL